MFIQEEFEQNKIENDFEPTHYTFNNVMVENKDGIIEAEIYFDKVRFRADGKVTKWFYMHDAVVKTVNHEIRLEVWAECDEFWPGSSAYKLKNINKELEKRPLSFDKLSKML